MLKSHEARRIREVYLINRTPIADLAEMYGMTYQTIWYVIRGKTHVDAGGPIIRSFQHFEMLNLARQYLESGMQTHSVLNHLQRNIPFAASRPMGDLLDDLIAVKAALYNVQDRSEE